MHDLATAQIAAHEWDAAGRTLRALLAASPDDAVAHLRLGMLLAPVEPEAAALHLLRAETDPALAGQARRVLDALPDGSRRRAESLTGLGIALGGAGEWALAQRALELALESSAANPVALAYLGYALDQQGMDGLPSLERARAMAPTDPQVNYLLGLHWRLAGDYEAAHAAFLRAYWAAPDNPALAAELGLTLREWGDLAQAEAWLRIAVALEPEQAQWIESLAAFYAETGFGLEGEGLTFLKAACERAPDNASLRASLGWALYHLGQTERAHEELSAAVALAPADVRSRYYFGMVLERLGDSEGALGAYEFVAEHAPPESLYAVLAARGLVRLGAPGQ
ncbi:MAG: tetratricopeptide repeat protein [Anaerolineae bacterium]|nr:tetratricopeptide repeat protein [Anaerolineae bacterium]